MEVRLKTKSKFKFNTAQIYFESSPNLFWCWKNCIFLWKIVHECLYSGNNLQNRVTEVISILWKLEYKRNAVNNMPYNTCLSLFVHSVCILCIIIYKCRNASVNCVTLSKVVTEVNKIHRYISNGFNGNCVQF